MGGDEYNPCPRAMLWAGLNEAFILFLLNRMFERRIKNYMNLP